MRPTTRREWLKDVGAAGAGTVLSGGTLSSASASQQSARPVQPDGTVVARTSTSDVFVPPRGRGFMKFSFDFPEPSIVFEGYEIGFRVFTHGNVYSLSRAHLTAAAVDGGLDVTCTELIWAGGQQTAPGQKEDT